MTWRAISARPQVQAVPEMGSMIGGGGGGGGGGEADGTGRAEAEYNGQTVGGGGGGGGGDGGGANTHTNTAAPRRKVELSGSYVDSRVAVGACHKMLKISPTHSPPLVS